MKRRESKKRWAIPDKGSLTIIVFSSSKKLNDAHLLTILGMLTSAAASYQDKTMPAFLLLPNRFYEQAADPLKTGQ